MKINLILPLLLTSVLFFDSAYAAYAASVDVKTPESPNKNDADKNDKDDNDKTNKNDTEKTKQKNTDDSTNKTPPSQQYIPQTDDDVDEETPKKPRKKRKMNRGSKAITSVSDDKRPLAKVNAICPMGLEGADAREIFRGFSFDGFQKASSDGEANLNHGFLPKPWGFYKGKDGVNYAVYAFKPDEKNIGMFLNGSVTNYNLSRLKIKEYCALYTEVGTDASNNNGPGRVGLVISRDSFFKPKPLDPGAVKVAAVMSMIQRGETSSISGDSSASSPKTSDKKDKSTDAADAKIFQKMGEEDKTATASPASDNKATDKSSDQSSTTPTADDQKAKTDTATPPSADASTDSASKDKDTTPTTDSTAASAADASTATTDSTTAPADDNSGDNETPST